MELPAKKLKTVDTNVDVQSIPPQNKKAVVINIKKKNDCLLKADHEVQKSELSELHGLYTPANTKSVVQNGPSTVLKSGEIQQLPRRKNNVLRTS